MSETKNIESETPAAVAGAATCSADFWITADELMDINDLSQRVLKSRQNVGTPMREAANKVREICKRINTNIPPNIRS